jgi:CheY-like chemotaxis protein
VRRLSILVLDDDPARHAEFARQGRGHRIDHVWFVDDAASRLLRHRYDLVCLDNDLETEGPLREGWEVAAFIASMPAERRPRAVLIHSWNRARARQMEDILRRHYQPGVSLLRAEFGSFRLVGPGPASDGPVDLRRWIGRPAPNHLAANAGERIPFHDQH